MSNLTAVLRFSWVYLKRYWVRLFLGVLLGMVFGLTNASFVWATRTLVGRFTPEPPVAVAAAKPAETSAIHSIGSSTDAAPEPQEQASREPLSIAPAQLEKVEGRLEQWIDPWLPAKGRELDWRQILGGLLFLPTLVLIRGASGYLSSYSMGWVSERVVNDLRVEVLAKLNTLSLDFYNRSSTGDLLTRINADTGSLHRAMRTGFPDIIKEVVTIIGIFLYLVFMDWKLTLISMIFVPLCLGPLLVLGKKARRASAKSINASVLQASQLVELISSIRVVRAFGLEDQQLQRFKRLSRELVRQGMRGVKAKEMVNPAIEIISTVAIGALILYLFATNSSIEDVIGFLTGMIFFYTPIKRLGALHIMMEQASVGVHRLVEVLNETPTVQEPARPKLLDQFQENIRFENVSFAYADQLVLRQVSLTIPRGFRLGVAGPSGSGKSTLVNLLLRFYDPTQGKILIDHLDLRELPSSNLRQQMALVSQEVVLFDLTVAENIACGKPGATRAEIEAAAEAAFAHDFIMELPQGYNTPIGERGITLSGGQRQRLAIARAFVRNAPILILDEATAALDAEAEGVVQAAIDRLAEHRTVIAVAHRLATLAGMDQIITLSNGRIIEQGSFSELLARHGTFADMAKRQGIHAALK